MVKGRTGGWRRGARGGEGGCIEAVEARKVSNFLTLLSNYLTLCAEREIRILLYDREITILA